MLFNSYIFLFVFLPMTLAGYFYLGQKYSKTAAIKWLALASFFFYGWWNPRFIFLLILTIVFNFAVGFWLTHHPGRKSILFLSVALDLLVLGYFKYANFFIDNINMLFSSSLIIDKIILPLGISFFTFTQIAYLVDAYKGQTREYSITNYVLFVTFFPHLIAGPILHHKEMMSQFEDKHILAINHRNLAVGLTVFILGLFKKVILADGLSRYVTLLFGAATSGLDLSFFEAWSAALGYTLQLYFDFSGYSDMAIGLALMFNLRLPINFLSPYKSVNIIEFWRRWHMTLSRFLRDYLYIPLGGNRKGKIRRYVNLMITMVLGGLWHGASWNFVIWGALHGFYLVVNHAWRAFLNRMGMDVIPTSSKVFWGRLITFVVVVVAWVPFRAANISSSFSIIKGMFGFNGVSLPLAAKHLLGAKITGIEFAGFFPSVKVISPLNAFLWIGILLMIVLFVPSTQEIMAAYEPAIGISKNMAPRFPRWSPVLLWAFVLGTMATACFLSLRQVSEFLYFQF